MESYERKFWQALRELFVGAKVEGKSGYVNLLRVKSNYFKNYLEPELQRLIETELEKHPPSFKEELYTKLYSFFHRYFSESGSIYFSYTPLYYKIYEKVYENGEEKIKEKITYSTDYEQILSDREDVALFWKTHMLYYIKTDRIIKSMQVDIEDEGFSFFFDASEVELKKGNEKRQLIYELKEIKKDGTIVLKVLYSERGKKTKIEEILRKTRKKFRNITEDTIKRAMRIFEKQATVDYFINKDAEKFLKEQFDLWMYQYLFSQEVSFTRERFEELVSLKKIAYKTIELIAKFEEELKKIWEKPRFVFNSNYVITLDRIAKKESGIDVIKELLNHPGIEKQVKEWKELGIVDENFEKGRILLNTLEGERLNDKYQFLPVDTKYFGELKWKILELFDNLDDELDGWLIKSENWQALNTILPKFRGKVQTIYIDPPFNTGKDFAYIDKFRDSTWLTLMDNRLKLAKEFLKSDGNFFLHLDENASYYGRMLLDRLGFEEIKEIIFDTNATKDEEADVYGYKSFGQNFTLKHQNIYHCSNSKRFFRKLWKPNRRETSLNIGWLDLIAKPKEDRKNQKKIEDFDFFIEKYKNGVITLEKVAVEEKIYPLSDIWNDIYSFTQSEMRTSENLSFQTQKPENLLRRIIQATTPTPSKLHRSIIMDFFAGSGTTVAVAHKLGRKWIGIEAGKYFHERYEDVVEIDNTDENKKDPYLIEIISESKSKIKARIYKIGILGRLKLVMRGDKEFKIGNKKRGSHLSKDINWQGGGFFKYYELEQYEEILQTVEYSDTDIKEYAESLKKLLKDDFTYSRVDPFIFDRKLSKAIEIDEKTGKTTLNLSKLYPDKEIDIAETLSNVKGLKIKKLTREFVEFENGEKVYFDNLNLSDFKELLIW